MAKLTTDLLKQFVNGYVDASKQAGAWNNGSTNNLYGLIDKIGKIVTLKGDFSDKLPELEGDELPAGKTIEETMIDLVLPTVYGANGTHPGVADAENAETEGANDTAPSYPSIEQAAYSYTLGRIKTKTTRPYDYIEAGCQNSAQVGDLAADILWALQSSLSVQRYFIKKYLLGNAITKAIAVEDASHNKLLVSVMGEPDGGVNATTKAEAFIRQVKKDIEEASFAGENKSLSKAFIGAAPELVLYIKKGVLPSLEVDALAGAFHSEMLAVPAKIKVVDSFERVKDGATDVTDKVFAFLCDPRGIKLHNSYRAIRSKENADGDFVNFVEHEENTGFISKHVYMHVYMTE